MNQWSFLFSLLGQSFGALCSKWLKVLQKNLKAPKGMPAAKGAFFKGYTDEKDGSISHSFNATYMIYH